MPLNPNGKIDKPALPFPDTAEAASSENRPSTQKLTPTEAAMQKIWSSILQTTPSPIPLNESFFDLGGHSILATRLIFEIRKAFVVNAPLGLIFDHPTLQEQAAAVDLLRNVDLGLAYQDGSTRSTDGKTLSVPDGRAVKKSSPAVEYSKDYEALLSRLQASYQPLPSNFSDRPLTIFLTGATGFLGIFILRELLSRPSRVGKVICHVRAKDAEVGLKRLRENAIDRGAWDDSWVAKGQVEVVVGDLVEEKFGLSPDVWERLANEADVVLHNGALVCVCIIQLPLRIFIGHLGSLGLSLRKTSSGQRLGNLDCNRIRVGRKTKACSLRVDYCDS